MPRSEPIAIVDTEWIEFRGQVLGIPDGPALEPVSEQIAKTAFYSGWLSALSIILPACANGNASHDVILKLRDLFIEVKAVQDAMGDS